MSALTFAEPMPGLAPHTDYTLDAVDGAVGLYSLRPGAQPGTRLFLLDAAVYMPDYNPDIDGPCRDIGLDSAEAARVLLVASPADTGTTVNLMAPVLVNETTGASTQAILGQGWPVRAELG